MATRQAAARVGQEGWGGGNACWQVSQVAGVQDGVAGLLEPGCWRPSLFCVMSAPLKVVGLWPAFSSIPQPTHASCPHIRMLAAQRSSMAGAGRTMAFRAAPAPSLSRRVALPQRASRSLRSVSVKVRGVLGLGSGGLGLIEICPF